MHIKPIEANVFRIIDAPGLDYITVMLREYTLPPPTRGGQVIVECYGKAWACYFGSIGPQSLVQFLSTDPDYLASKLARGGEKKSERDYLLRIARVVVEACAQIAAAKPGEVGR